MKIFVERIMDMTVEEILATIKAVEKNELEMLEENITPSKKAAGSGFGCNCG